MLVLLLTESPNMSNLHSPLPALVALIGTIGVILIIFNMLSVEITVPDKVVESIIWSAVIIIAVLIMLVNFGSLLPPGGPGLYLSQK